MNKILWLGLLMLAAAAANAAVPTIDQAVTVGSSSSPVTISINVDETNTDRIVVVTSSWRAGSPVALNTVTADDLPVSHIRTDERTGFPQFCRSTAWVIRAPRTGVQDVILTWASNVNSSSVAYSIHGVDGGDAIGADAGRDGIGTSITNNITTEKANSLLIDIACGAGGGLTFTEGGSQTKHLDLQVSDMKGAGSSKDAVTAGANSTSWTKTNSHDCSSIIEIRTTDRGLKVGRRARRRGL